MVVAGGQGGRNAELFNEYRVTFGKIKKKVLEMDGGDSCRAVCEYTLKYTLKWLKL